MPLRVISVSHSERRRGTASVTNLAHARHNAPLAGRTRLSAGDHGVREDRWDRGSGVRSTAPARQMVLTSESRLDFFPPTAPARQMVLTSESRLDFLPA